MATQKLNLTRDQLATFLKNHELVKQFEALFGVVDAIAPDVVQAAALQAGNADAAANEALSQIISLAQESAINAGNASQQANEALGALNRMANALEMLASMPAIKHDNSVVTDYIDLPEVGPHVSQPRRVQWNRDDGTMDIGLYGGSVLQVGQEIHYYAKNTSGSLIANGTPVMFTGTVGASGKLTFGLAVANGSVPAEYMMGVATQDVATNAFGYVTSFGLVRGFNTTGSPYGEVWADGDLLYFDPAASGTWTNVQPAAPNIHVPVAVVINASSGGSGSIFVRMEASIKLGLLQDVSTTSLAGNDILIYDSVDGRWENRAPTQARDALGLGTGNPTNGQLLIGNGADFTTASLTAGSGIAITPGVGSLTIESAIAALVAGANISITGATTKTIAVSGLGSMAFESTGDSGSFTTVDLKTVTVVNGVITSIV
jgi:hypothetical protein